MDNTYIFMYEPKEDGLHSRPFRIRAKEDRLVMDKREDFDKWASDETVLSTGQLRREADREVIHRMIDAWLDGKAYG